jgi:hypothetical protein
MVRTEDRNTELTRTELSDPSTAADRFERRRAADYAAAFGRDAFDWRDQATPLQAAPETAA